MLSSPPPLTLAFKDVHARECIHLTKFLFKDGFTKTNKKRTKPINVSGSVWKGGGDVMTKRILGLACIPFGMIEIWGFLFLFFVLQKKVVFLKKNHVFFANVQKKKKNLIHFGFRSHSIFFRLFIRYKEVSLPFLGELNAAYPVDRCCTQKVTSNVVNVKRLIFLDGLMLAEAIPFSTNCHPPTLPINTVVSIFCSIFFAKYLQK